MKLNILIITALLLSAAPAMAQQDKTAAKKQIKQTKSANVKTLDAEAGTSGKAEEKKGNESDPIKSLPLEQQTVLKNFAAWDNKLNTLQTDYDQVTSFEDTEISSSQGRLYKNGNNIRLDTLENDKVVQSALTDKKIIKINDENGKLITSLTWDDWQSVQPNKALFDFGNYSKILQNHKLKIFEKQPNTYRLVFQSMLFGVNQEYELEFLLDGKDYFPLEISISSEGVKTKTTLKNAQKNIKFKESVFK